MCVYCLLFNIAAAGKHMPGKCHHDVAHYPRVAQDIVVETSLGTLGFMTVSSYTPDGDRAGLLMGGSSLDLDRIQQQGTQSLSSGDVKVRLYTG
jgi:hypothetical protein